MCVHPGRRSERRLVGPALVLPERLLSATGGASLELQLHLPISCAYFRDQRSGDRVGVVGEDREPQDVRLIQWQVGGEARVEVGVLEGDQPPPRPIGQAQHVEVLALVTAQVHRVKGARARHPRPAQLHRVDVGPVRAVGRHADQAAKAAPALAGALDPDPDPDPQGRAVPSVLP
jgi:hypothetical protein